MKEYSVAMSLVDFVPVVLFAAAAVMLMRGLYNKMSKGAFAVFSAGMIDVVFAGTFKALYKLLYASGVCDFSALSDMFFPVQAIGFLLAGCGAISLLRSGRGSLAAAAAAPPVFSGTFVFVGIMIAGLAMLYTGLCALSAKIKKPAIIVFFVLSFILSLCMGYLSSRDFASASLNWMAETVNIAAQGTLFAGVLLLRKTGLAETEPEKAGK